MQLVQVVGRPVQLAQGAEQEEHWLPSTYMFAGHAARHWPLERNAPVGQVAHVSNDPWQVAHEGSQGTQLEPEAIVPSGQTS